MTTAPSDHEVFEEICDVLYRRYVDMAAPNGEPRPKVIVVVGAGASVWSNMPLWNAPHVKRRVVECAKLQFPGFAKEAWRRLGPKIGLPGRAWAHNQAKLEEELIERGDVTTDMLCGVAMQFETISSSIRRLLCDLYLGSYAYHPQNPTGSAGMPPQLGYELIAHLLKHGFVDHVISFNFDRLLDAAVENELAAGDFQLILSDHAVLDDRTDDAGSPRVLRPRVIKIHGSADSEATLRFADRDTGILTPRMIDLLDETIFGIDLIKKEPTPDSARPVHILSLGYSWNDPDFARWIESRADRIDRLFLVRKERIAPCVLTDGDGHPTAGSPLAIRALGTDTFAADGCAPIAVDHLLWAIWNRLDQKLESGADQKAPGGASEGGIPRMPVSRHLILGHLFGPKLDPHGRVILDQNGILRLRHDHDTRRRFAVELLLHVIKCRGMVNASVMADDFRIRKYRRRVDPDTADDVLEKILNPSRFPDVRETFFSPVQGPKLQDAGRQFHDQLIHQLDQQLGGPPGSVLVPRVLEQRLRFEEVDQRKFLLDEILRIFVAPEIELRSGTDPRNEWLFRHAKAIGSYPELFRITNQLLSTDWTHLLLVAESAEWITASRFGRPEPDAPPREIWLIRAEPPPADEWPLRDTVISSRLQEADTALRTKHNITTHFADMPWWEHNRHLTLALDLERNRVIGAIYFHRRMKTTRIAPVLLDTTDGSEVLCTFLSYLRRSLQLTELSRPSRELAQRACDIESKLVRCAGRRRERVQTLLREVKALLA